MCSCCLVSGGVLHSYGPDVHHDSSVHCVWSAGGCVRIPGGVWRLLPHHDGSHSVRARRAHASLAGHRLPSGPHGSSHDSRSTHRWWEAQSFFFVPAFTTLHWFILYSSEGGCSDLAPCTDLRMLAVSVQWLMDISRVRMKEMEVANAEQNKSLQDGLCSRLWLERFGLVVNCRLSEVICLWGKKALAGSAQLPFFLLSLHPRSSSILHSSSLTTGVHRKALRAEHQFDDSGLPALPLANLFQMSDIIYLGCF